VVTGLDIAMVSKLTVEDDVRRKLLAIVLMKAGLPSRPIVVVDHPQSITAPQPREAAGPRDGFSYGEAFEFAVIAKRVETVRSVADIVQCGLVFVVFVTRCNYRT
jgi:hypothetical protein